MISIDYAKRFRIDCDFDDCVEKDIVSPITQCIIIKESASGALRGLSMNKKFRLIAVPLFIAIGACAQQYDIGLQGAHIEGDLPESARSESNSSVSSPSSAPESESVAAIEDASLPAEFRCGQDGRKVLICHVPPGNPSNAHSICISRQGAVRGHGIQFPKDGVENGELRSHSGDTLGACKGDAQPPKDPKDPKCPKDPRDPSNPQDPIGI